MSKKRQIALTSSATAVWSGELRAEFRQTVGEIVKKPLTDDAWDGLCNAVRKYAVLLSLEYSAVGPGDQVKAVERAAKACAALIETLQVINQPEYGSLLTGLVSDKWEEISHRQQEAERNLEKLAANVDEMVGAGRPHTKTDFDEDELQGSLETETPGQQSVRAWLYAGMLVRPSLGADLLVDLWEVSSALQLTVHELRTTDQHKIEVGFALRELIGQLTIWAKSHRLVVGVSNKGEGQRGRMTKLVRAIIQEVPILYDEDGRKAEKQIRYYIASESALAQAILKVRKA